MSHSDQSHLDSSVLKADENEWYGGLSRAPSVEWVLGVFLLWTAGGRHGRET